LCLRRILDGKISFYMPENWPFSTLFSDAHLVLEAKFPADWIALFQEFSWKNPFD